MNATAPASRIWSPLQEAIFADVATGKGHTFVMARAGTGKTTTILEALRSVPRGYRSLLVAFNKSIANELAAKAPKGVDVKILHGFGLSSVTKAFGQLEINGERSQMWARNRHPAASHRYRNALCVIVSKAKNTLTEDVSGLDDLVDRFGVDFSDDPSPKAREIFLNHASEMLEEQKQPSGGIDYDDMIWLPAVHGLSVWQYDRVFIDEAQDLNAAQISLALKACRKGGRITAVGDDRQAIYAFRGADPEAVARLTSALNAKILPLSVTYRCAPAIVEVARAIVPDFTCGRVGEKGTVAERSKTEMLALATAGDFILSRTNAPLVSIAMGFLKEGRRVAIQGRDLAAGLVGLIHQSKAESVVGLSGWVSKWLDREVARLTKAERDPQSVIDRAESILAVAAGAKTVHEIITKIQTVFDDGDDASRITLSSTHRAKGLERNRVWVLANTFRPSKGREEANLWYVAVTRAKDVLYMVEWK